MAATRMTAIAALAAVCLASAAPARAQDVMTKESVASLKASFVADLGAMQKKFE